MNELILLIASLFGNHFNIHLVLMKTLHGIAVQKVERLENASITYSSETTELSICWKISESRSVCEVVNMKHATVQQEGSTNMQILLNNELIFILKLDDENERRQWMNLFLCDGICTKIEDTPKSRGKTLRRIQSVRKTEDMKEKIKLVYSKEPRFFPRLVRFSGFRNQVTSTWVDPRASSLNKDSCFILDDGKENLFYWRGKNSNMFVREECQIIISLIKERSKTYEVIQLEQGEENSSFWKLLGGKSKPADLNFEANAHQFIKMNIESEIYEIVKEKAEIENLLNGGSCIALDTGFEIIYIDGNESESSALLNTIAKYKEENNRSSWHSRPASSKDKMILHYANKK